MTRLPEYFLFVSVFYLIGSIPFSYLIAKLKQIDPRSVGSGNVGATNVARSAGFIFGVLALVLDLLKGFTVVLLAVNFEIPVYLAGFVVIGHNWSLFLKFTGGKGVATSLGLILGISWIACIITAGIWLLLLALTRYVSVASVSALLSAPIWIGLLGGSTLAIGLMAVLGLLSVFQHRNNFKKLRSGEENRVG